MRKGIIESEYGTITIKKDVIAQYAGHVAATTAGVIGMAGFSIKDGVYKILKRESLRKGVDIDIENNELIINFHIFVNYGVRIPVIANNIIDNVMHTIKSYIGLSVKEINIYVEGMRNMED